MIQGYSKEEIESLIAENKMLQAVLDEAGITITRESYGVKWVRHAASTRQDTESSEEWAHNRKMGRYRIEATW